MANFDLHTVMQHLAQRRPVLRPRGDFDQSLAAEIQRRYPEASVLPIRPLVLKGRYLCQWRHYFSLTSPRRNGEFRYLLLKV